MKIKSKKDLAEIIKAVHKTKRQYKIKNLNCINCNNPRPIGNKRCPDCFKKHNKEKRKDYQKNYNLKKRKRGTCSECWNEIIIYRENQSLCKKCYIEQLKTKLSKKVI